MRNRLSSAAVEILTEWKRADRKFFRKNSDNPDVMTVVASLAEMIATFDSKPQSIPSFHC